MDEEIELAVENVAHFREDPRNILVRADVTGRNERTFDGIRKLAHVLLEPLALEREGELRALVGEAARDRPRDRAAVGHARDQAGLALEASGHGKILGVD